MRGTEKMRAHSAHVLLMRLHFGVHSHKLLDYLLSHPNGAGEQIINYCVQFQCFFFVRPDALAVQRIYRRMKMASWFFNIIRAGSCYSRWSASGRAHWIAIEMPKNYHFEHEKSFWTRQQKRTERKIQSRQRSRFFRVVVAAHIVQYFLFRLFWTEYLWRHSWKKLAICKIRFRCLPGKKCQTILICFLILPNCCRSISAMNFA